MTQLSRSFHLSEFVTSQEAARRGIDNTPDARAVASLEVLCRRVLQPVRDYFARPVTISSGYRSPRLNRIIGGSRTSQHCLGEAADFEVPGISNVEVCRWLERHLAYDQLILEFYRQGDPASGWVHCSYRVGRLRNQELTAMRTRFGTRYLSGIVA